jgi:hypothetical protein
MCVLEDLRVRVPDTEKTPDLRVSAEARRREEPRTRGKSPRQASLLACTVGHVRGFGDLAPHSRCRPIPDLGLSRPSGASTTRPVVAGERVRAARGRDGE